MTLQVGRGGILSQTRDVWCGMMADEMGRSLAGGRRDGIFILMSLPSLYLLYGGHRGIEEDLPRRMMPCESIGTNISPNRIGVISGRRPAALFSTAFTNYVRLWP